MRSLTKVTTVRLATATGDDSPRRQQYAYDSIGVESARVYEKDGDQQDRQPQHFDGAADQHDLNEQQRLDRRKLKEQEGVNLTEWQRDLARAHANVQGWLTGLHTAECSFW